jgi:DNA-binding transcriptional regulator GbsR (MarR family)
MLSKERILSALGEFGISRSDGIMYIYLAKMGPKKEDELAKALKMSKQQLKTSLKKLEYRGLIITGSKKTTTYSALPFDKVFESLIYAKMEKAKAIQNRKVELLALWESIKSKEEV